MKVYTLSSPNEIAMLLTADKETADRVVELGAERRIWDTDSVPHCRIGINVGDDE